MGKKKTLMEKFEFSRPKKNTLPAFMEYDPTQPLTKARSVFFFGLENSNFSIRVFFFPVKLYLFLSSFPGHKNSKKC